MANETKWYHYSQNNSGGFFKEPAMEVYVEAHTPEEANARAESIGLYFDGDDDCRCCGRRWSEQRQSYSVTLDKAPEKERATYLRRYEASARVPVAIRLSLSATVPEQIPVMTDEEARAVGQRL